MDRSLFPDSISHIKSLKDVQTLNLTENPSYNNEMVRNDDSLATKPAPFICPVMGLEMNGKYRFLFLWKCGCVFSERAFKEISAKTKLCVKVSNLINAPKKMSHFFCGFDIEFFTLKTKMLGDWVKLLFRKLSKV